MNATKPRGRNQQARWYATRTRPAECLFVIELPNGSLGKHNGAVGVSERRDVMEAVVDRFSGTSGPRAGWTVRAWTFEEGVQVHRLRDFAAVARMFA